MFITRSNSQIPMSQNFKRMIPEIYSNKNHCTHFLYVASIELPYRSFEHFKQSPTLFLIFLIEKVNW